MSLRQQLIGLSITAIVAASAGAWAQNTQPADCEAFAGIDSNKSFDVDPKDIDQCIQRGWDPPLNWRPNEGKSKGVAAPGSGGVTVGGRNPPERSPGQRNMPASISSNMFNFTLGIPPWRGFPCQLPGGIDLCGDDDDDGNGGTGGTGGGPGGGPGGGGSSCPVAGDTTGTYGEQQPITAGTSKTLACGGAVPLSTYLMAANDSPVSVLATEAGSRTVWFYRASGNGYALQGTLELPANTCATSDPDSATPTPLPIAQIIAIGPNTASVALRLETNTEGGVADPFDTDPEAERARYYVVPTSGGAPQISSGCPRTSDFIRGAESLTVPLTVESSTTPGCEGSAELCAGQTANPTTPSNCDAVTTNPAGESCSGTTLFAVLNRPNLLFPPNSTANFTPMEGRTAHMVGSSGGVRLYTQSDTIMYFGASGGSFLLPEGGIMKLDNGNLLVLNGPATVNAAARQVTMANGGSVQTNGGSTVQNFASGSSYAPPAALPFVVKVSRSVELPANMRLPTQPNPFVRLPVKAD